MKTAQVDETINQKSGAIIRSQTAGLDLGNGFHLPFRVGLGKRPAYPAGNYDIDPKSFALNGYGDLTLGRYVDLVSVDHKPAPAGK
ncbi:single-stranded DNA-binding protein [Luteimonas salinilitoris]|uniref:single-stranded DNA-binding protein n=1 Tax=Luteimonas salinilitoris TaxID=3237697 RepID=UPI00351C9CA3